MPDWRPIRCRYCGCLHEQPDAAKTSRLCYEYCLLHSVKRAPPQWDTVSKRVHVILDAFPELSERKR